MSTCPACGVAVIPGYVKCPKCGGALPFRSKAIFSAGGTAVEESTRSRSLAFAVGAALVVAIVVVVIATRSRGVPRATTATPAVTTSAGAAGAEVPPPSPPVAASPDIDVPSVAAPDPRAAAAAFDQQLKRLRLWGTAAADGPQLLVRSGACEDPAMGALLQQQTVALRAAGLTKLRCLTQSGGVVFERDL